MKVILTGGGTGGHVIPAVAIAQALIKKYPKAEILLIGRGGGEENNEILRAGFELKEIKVYGIERSFTFKNVRNVFTALLRIGTAKKLIKQFEPDAVIGTGGYVCWPVLKAAQSLGIATFIHESNVYPGLVTRLLSPKCSATLLNHIETEKYLKNTDNTFCVGNPIRREFLSVTRESARQKLSLGKRELLIVSFGGSGGAQNMNDCITEMMSKYELRQNGIRHIHATGRKYYSNYKDIRLSSGNCRIVPYIDDMPTYLKAADAVICRAGAMTLSEIASVGCPAILIPSPNVTNNHQYKNAQFLAQEGAAVMLEESSLTAETLYRTLKEITHSESKRKSMSKCIEKFANRNSADDIVNLISKTLK